MLYDLSEIRKIQIGNMKCILRFYYKFKRTEWVKKMEIAISEGW